MAFAAVSLRRVEQRSFGVLDGWLVPGGVLVESGWTLAPPFLTRLQLYPRDGVEVGIGRELFDERGMFRQVI